MKAKPEQISDIDTLVDEYNKLLALFDKQQLYIDEQRKAKKNHPRTIKSIEIRQKELDFTKNTVELLVKRCNSLQAQVNTALSGSGSYRQLKKQFDCLFLHYREKGGKLSKNEVGFSKVSDFNV